VEKSGKAGKSGKARKRGIEKPQGVTQRKRRSEKAENNHVGTLWRRERKSRSAKKRKLEARKMKEHRKRQNTKTELEERTLDFSLAVIGFVVESPRSLVGDVVGRQLIKSATAVGANDREANRAESKEDFIHKTGIAEKEAAETVYWLEICVRGKSGSDAGAQRLLAEANELLAIITTINRKAKHR
jgi:four helix bundle protein